MKYYMMIEVDVRKQAFCESAEDYDEKYKLDSHNIEDYRKIVDWNEEALFEYTEDKKSVLSASDFLSNDLGLIIVSKKVQNIIQELKLDNELQLLPIKIRERKSNIINDSYAILYIYNFVDAFDKSKAITKELTAAEHTILLVMKYAFKRDKLNNSTFFKIKESISPMFVSEEIVRKFRNEKVKGVEFSEQFCS